MRRAFVLLFVWGILALSSGASAQTRPHVFPYEIRGRVMPRSDLDAHREIAGD